MKIIAKIIAVKVCMVLRRRLLSNQSSVGISHQIDLKLRNLSAEFLLIVENCFLKKMRSGCQGLLLNEFDNKMDFSRMKTKRKSKFGSVFLVILLLKSSILLTLNCYYQIKDYGTGNNNH